MVIDTAPTRISAPLSSTSAPTTVTASVTLLTMPWMVCEDLAQIDHRHVRETALTSARLHARARVRIARALSGEMKVCGASSNVPGPEHEHEAAGAEVLPVHPRTLVTRAVMIAPEDVEAHLVADARIREAVVAIGERSSIDTSASPCDGVVAPPLRRR